MWIDRWESEPVPALILDFCWVQPLLMSGNASADADMVGATIQAPLVAELSKGAGVLLLFFLRRRTFDGPIDGVVHAGMIAAGFAFTENILYFGQVLEESNGSTTGLIGVFVMRGLMSPFAHLMFTASLGICVGFAARNSGTLMVLGAWVVGLVPAMLLHGLWNASSFLGGKFFLVYAVLQVPLFALFMVGIIPPRCQEAKLTRRRLAEYVPSGWFTPQEVPMLATGGGRRRALAWSKTFVAGTAGSPAATRFVTGQEHELMLLNKLTAVRSDLLGRHAAAVWQGQQRQAQQMHYQHAQNQQPPY